MAVGAITSSTAATQSDLYAVALSRNRMSQRDTATSPAASLFPPEDTAPAKVGFGSDSVKLPGIAASTIRRNLRDAKQVVPTVEESDSRVRQRIAEERRQTLEQEFTAPPPLNLTQGRRDAANQAGQYISSLNTAAGNALARTGQGEQPPTNRLNIRIGDTEIPFDKPQTRPTLDLLA